MKTPKTRSLKFVASTSAGKVSALFMTPDNAWSVLVFAHGAGAGMKHPFMEKMSGVLAAKGIATFRYQFPYMEKGMKRPDPQPVLLSTVRSAVEAAVNLGKDLPLFAGGKSMGGRMTSLAAAKEPLPFVNGIVFFGFPLHPSGSPSTERAGHLEHVSVPLLFLQGTRDHLADLSLLKPVCANTGNQSTLYVVEGADHSFNVPRSAGSTVDDVLDALATTVSSWMLSFGGPARHPKQKGRN